MKVLEEGKWKLKWEMEKVCGDASCGARVLVEEADVVATDYQTGYHAVCAVCGGWITLTKKELPRRMTDFLDKKRKYSSSSDW